MLRSMFLLWIFMVLFGYGREANRMLRIVLGIAVFGWAARIILSFGFSMLPIILRKIMKQTDHFRRLGYRGGYVKAEAGD